MADDPAVRFAWGSERVQAWARSVFTVAAVADRASAERAYATHRGPAHPRTWPALIAFEAQFGGLVWKTLTGSVASAAWTRNLRHAGRGLDVVRADREGNTNDPDTDAEVPIPPEVDGVWLAAIWIYDADLNGEYVDEAGETYWVGHEIERAHRTATDVRSMFEKHALSAEVRARRGWAEGTFHLEIDGDHGAAIARAAGIPAVPEASDAVSRNFWDGTFNVRASRTTHLTTGDLPRLIEAARHLRDLAPPVVRVVGDDGYGHTRAFCARLRAELPDLPISLAIR